MIEAPDSKLTKIGVFYDGGYFQSVNSYYKYVHERRAGLSIDGIHRFAQQKVAEMEGTDVRYCHVVDAHYFRGRYNIESVIERNNLENERRFDDVLMRAGITTHYLPRSSRDEEKGIDVWFALEAFELAVYKRFNVLVLLACDSDYVPLIRKLNTLGTRVMLLGWDFKYTDRSGTPRETRTAQQLIDEVTYPIEMHSVIDNRSLRNDPIVNGLFYSAKPKREIQSNSIPEAEEISSVAPQRLDRLIDEVRRGTINTIKEGYGFVTDSIDKKSRFFHHSSVENDGFNLLNKGDEVEFQPVEDDRSGKAINLRVISA